MVFNLGSDFKEKLNNDFNKKYLISGRRIAGEASDDKVKLYLEDDFGKHSAFTSRYFYGKISGDKLIGNFRPATYVIVLLLILMAVAIESLVAAIVLQGYSSIIMPCVIIAAVVLYFVFIKKLSSENDMLILKYLENL